MTLTTRQQIAQNVLYDLLGDYNLIKSEKKVIQAALNEYLPREQRIAVDGDFGRNTALALNAYFKKTDDTPLWGALHPDLEDLMSRHVPKKDFYSPSPYDPDGVTALRAHDILKGDFRTSRDKIAYLQEELGLKADGDFGTVTAGAVIAHYKQHPEYLKDINPAMVRRIMAIDGRAEELQDLLKEHAPGALNAHISELIPLVRNSTGTDPVTFELQAMLKAQGLYNGGLDGVKGATLDRAIQSFESGRKLTANTDAFQESVIPDKERTQAAFASASTVPGPENTAPGVAPVLPGNHIA